jgi:hypothetical protein
MTTPPAPRAGRSGDGPLLTLAWFAVVLVVVFTIAFWVGRAVGPAPDAPERPPVAPHAPMQGH